MSASEARFEISVGVDDCRRFAELSGDWNPLHTDSEHASQSVYGRQVLHGAFSAGLISRLAGMHLPGRDCLLYGMQLRFVSPILPPATLVVHGKVVSYSLERSRVEARVSDAKTGALYVDASYEHGYHGIASVPGRATVRADAKAADAVVLVTGGSGGLGAAVLQRLGNAARAASRNPATGRLDAKSLAIDGRPVSAIVHCGWPAPDNRRLIDLDEPLRAITHHVTGPLQDIQTLAAFLATHGTPNASLVLVGSTFAKAGRHLFKMPLYSVAKSTIPTIVEILALELASQSRRCFGVVFDVLDGGMNKGISESARLANADRSPWGLLATPQEAADQIAWLLDNDSRLLSGATLTLSSGSIP